MVKWTKVLDIPAIKIVSINQKYILARKSRRLVLNPLFRDFKQKLCFYCERYLVLANLNISSFTKVKIEVETYTDIDACIKVVLDAVSQAIGIDDKVIEGLEVKKKKIKRVALGSIKVFVK